jgi:hypothetical protein
VSDPKDGGKPRPEPIQTEPEHRKDDKMTESEKRADSDRKGDRSGQDR